MRGRAHTTKGAPSILFLPFFNQKGKHPWPKVDEKEAKMKKNLVVYHTKIHEFARARLTETATGAAPMKLSVKSDERHRKRKLTEQKGAKKERKYARAL